MNDFRADLFRSDLDALVEMPPPLDLRDAVVRASHRAVVRRAVLAVVASVTVVLIGTALAVLPRHGVIPTDPSPSASITAPPTPTGSPTVGPSVSPTPEVSGSPVDLNPLPHPPASPTVPTTILNATLDIPSWMYESTCPAGKRTFVDGHATAVRTTVYNIHADVSPVYADVDGDPGDEVLIAISCDNNGSVHPEQLLALKPSAGGAFTTLGFVLPVNPLLVFDDDDVSVKDRVVSVVVSGPRQSNGGNLALKQVRQYQYDVSGFHQVAGATTFPPLPTSVHDIDPRNTTLNLAFESCDSCPYASVRFESGVGSDTMVVWQDVSPTTFLPVRSGRIHFAYTIGDVSALSWADGTQSLLVTVTRRADDGYTSTAVFAVTVNPLGSTPSGERIVKTGVDGVTGIVSVHSAGTVAVITVMTTHGQEIRRYERDVSPTHDPSLPWWPRLS